MFEQQQSPEQQGSAGQTAAPVSTQETPSSGLQQNASIYTMPESFIGGGAATHASPGASQTRTSGSRLVLIVGMVALVLGGITAGAYWYINNGGDITALFGGSSENGEQQPEQPSNQNQPEPEPAQNTNTPEAPSQDEAAQIARDAKRAQDVVTIARALQEYFARFNAYPQLIQVIPKDILPDEPRDPLTKRLYAYTPRDSRQSYSIVIEAERKLEFNGKTYERGSWEFYPADLTGEGPTAPETPTVPSPETPTGGSSDADSDGLTEAEENVFGTSAVNPDTDSDGYRDNIEIANFYNPTDAGAIKLDQAGLVKLHTSEAGKYSFYYPSSWVVSSPTTGSETLITTTTGENFSIITRENPDGKTSWEWYTQNVSHDFNPNNVAIITIGGKEAIKTRDGLEAYVAVGTVIHVIRYERNDATSIRYPAIFDFLLKRFTLL